MLQWARKRAGMTQQDLAQATGMPQPSIARIEAGTVVPRTATLITLLEATGHELSVDPRGPSADRELLRRLLAMEVPRRTREAVRGMPAHIIRRLSRFAVPFVLIGELAEVAHGSPIKVGGVIEVCVATTGVAQDRLKLALDDDAAKTDAGRLRIVTETAAGDDYDVLARNSVDMHVVAGVLFPVAALEDLMRSRRAGATKTDQEAAAALGAIIEESQRHRRGRPDAARTGLSAPGVRGR
jgi:transcriptional regulator with XRE-family HTH domain